ncbi:hypothetical protein [Sphingomonas oryzagri]|uniref:Uncharacterized protein n=1 Tax=Sphingomonas oryzagri TaxID=3042314 RepID=A0ABT6N7W7_9SPHN|nr:hypothetical protein [Sphingomonas oryzagri]MDH7641175.1 hypothetical protein [Sphingomonas oryzagri]
MGELHTLPLPAETPAPRYHYAGVRADTSQPFSWYVLDRGPSGSGIREMAACESEADACAIVDALRRAEGVIWMGYDPSTGPDLHEIATYRPGDFKPIVLGTPVCEAAVYADTPGARRMIELRTGVSAEQSTIRASIRAFRNGVQALMIRLGFTEAADDAFLAWELMTLAGAFHRDTELAGEQRIETLQRAMRDLLYFDGYSYIASNDGAIDRLAALIASGVGFAG